MPAGGLPYAACHIPTGVPFTNPSITERDPMSIDQCGRAQDPASLN